MGLNPERIFLDASFFDLVYRQSHKRSINIYFDLQKRKYVLKEFYRFFASEGRRADDIGRIIDEIKRKRILIEADNSKAKTIQISDKSDAPTIAAAKASDATLVNAD